jgi:hypothetical protein
MQPPDLTRYELQLEMLERNAALDDRAAMDLLSSEFALAHNAAYFDAVSIDDIAFDVLARSTPQEGVTRFTVMLELLERRPQLRDLEITALLARAFTKALNASYFLRVCTDDHLTLRLLSRELVVDETEVRRAA